MLTEVKKIIYIDPNLIAFNVMNNRGEEIALSRTLSGSKRTDLYSSIKQYGVLTPIIVFQPSRGCPGGKKYVAIDGHNRLGIARELRISIPCHNLRNISWEKAYSLALINNRGVDPLKKNLSMQDQLRAIKHILGNNLKPTASKIEELAKTLALVNAEKQGRTGKIEITISQLEMFKSLIKNSIAVLNDPWLLRLFNSGAITFKTAGKISVFFSNHSPHINECLKQLVESNTYRDKNGRVYIRKISYESFDSFNYELSTRPNFSSTIMRKVFDQAIGRENYRAPSFQKQHNWLANRANIGQVREYYKKIGKLLKYKEGNKINA